MRTRWLGLLAVLLTGCPDRSIDKIPPTQSGVMVKKIPISADIDILFVIDNSQSTIDKQTVFSQNFPRFVQALDGFPMGRPNLHIGVVDTTVDIGTPGYAIGNMGCPSPDPRDNGLLQNTPRLAGCAAPDGQFLGDIRNPDGSRTVNHGGPDGRQTLEQALSCIALVGAEGCGFEAPLEAMKRALDGSRPESAGFIRNGAYLGVIVLTDEDDASVKDQAVFLIAPCPMQDAATPAAAGPRPCWWIQHNPAGCPAPDTGFELALARTQPPAPGTNVVVECALTPVAVSLRGRRPALGRSRGP